MQKKYSICLINPPHEGSLDSLLDPPLGLMYISSTFKKLGHKVNIIDLSFCESKFDWYNVIERGGVYDLYGITTMTASYYNSLLIRDIIKEINPSNIVMIGGAHPSSLPEETKKDFDIVIVGEFESVVHKVINYIDYVQYNLNNMKSNSEVSISNIVTPIIFYSDTDKFDIDEIPSPDRHSLPIKKYTRLVDGDKATSVIASRGCPYRCSYCINSGRVRISDKVRFRNIYNVITELKMLIYDFNYKNFIFYDDTFTINPKLDELLNKIKDLNITFRCNGNARKDDYDKFKRLYDAGCREIDFGIESGSQTILDNINKGVTVEQNKQAILDAKKAGLTVKTFLMVGSPGETWETIEETVKFMWDVKPQLYTLFNFVPLPGCEIWNDPEKYKIKIINKDWRQYYNIGGQNVGGLVIETEKMTSKEIGKARKYLLEKLPPQIGMLQNYYKKLG